MTIYEAKKRIQEALSHATDDEYPLVWVGEYIKEDVTHIWIEATTYAEGENPKDVAIPYWVNKETGNVLPGIELK